MLRRMLVRVALRSRRSTASTMMPRAGKPARAGSPTRSRDHARRRAPRPGTNSVTDSTIEPIHSSRLPAFIASAPPTVPGMPTANSSPVRPSENASCTTRREDDAGARAQVVALERVPLEVATEHRAPRRRSRRRRRARCSPCRARVHSTSSSARIVGGRGEIGDGGALDEQRGRTADAVGRVARHRLVAPHRAGQTAHVRRSYASAIGTAATSLSAPARSARTSSGPIAVTSPAPIVSTRSPGRTRDDR